MLNYHTHTQFKSMMLVIDWHNISMHALLGANLPACRLSCFRAHNCTVTDAQSFHVPGSSLHHAQGSIPRLWMICHLRVSM